LVRRSFCSAEESINRACIKKFNASTPADFIGQGYGTFSTLKQLTTGKKPMTQFF